MTTEEHHHAAAAAEIPRGTTRRHLLTAVAAGVLTVALIAAVAMWLGSAGDSKDAAIAKGSEPSRPRSAAVNLANLTESNTHTRIDDAPADPGPPEATNGAIVHPRKTMAVHAAPNGTPIAKVKPTQLGDTWLPVIDKRDGWIRVLLPSKPNGSTGWLRDKNLDHAVTPYLIRAHLKSMRLQLLFEGREVGGWPIGIGMPSTPTPVGRTFLLGSFVDPEQDFSPIILPLGTHSATLDTFGGGPGTVAIHTWPTTDVLGKASSNGCIRVPKDALTRLTEVPLGTVVLVDER